MFVKFRKLDALLAELKSAKETRTQRLTDPSVKLTKDEEDAATIHALKEKVMTCYVSSCLGIQLICISLIF